MVDPKKFVAYFLVLASIASSVAFVFSGVLRAPGASTPATTASTQEKTPPLVSSNAFVEKVPDNSPKVDFEPGLPSVITTDNLTQNVSQNLTREFFRANMDGPQIVNGESVVSLPSDAQINTTIVKKLASSETAALISLPVFGENAPRGQLNINSNNGPKELGLYLAALDKALKDTILSKDFKDLLGGESSFDAVSAAQLAHARALYNLKTMSVPSVLSELHARALTLVSDAKKIVDVPTDNADDPLKTLAVMKGVSGKIVPALKNDFANLSAEVKKLEAQNISVLPPGKDRSAISRMLIPEAEAILGVNISTLFDLNSIGDYVSNYGSWIEQIWEWAQKAILQQLIHALILMVQQQIVGWISGQGDPQFVTNWQDLIGFVYDSASDSTINRIMGIACNGFNVNLRAGFLPSPTYNTRFSCTISDILRNSGRTLAQFENGFGAGGFEAYGSVVQQNFFILSMETSDEALNTAIAAQTAKVKDATVGGGFLSTKKCADGSKPDSFSDTCYDGSTPVLTTPGQTIGLSVSKALELGPDSIVNATDITGLVTAIVNASINRLIGAGLNGLLGTYADAPRTRTLAESCANLTGQAQANCLNSASDANTINNSPDTIRPSGTTPDNTTIIPTIGGLVTSTLTTPPITVITPVVCWPPTQTVLWSPASLGAAAFLLAVGGDGTYGWFTPLGNPSSLSGGMNIFETAYMATSTTYNVSVTSPYPPIASSVTNTCQVTTTDDPAQVSTSTPPAPTLTTLVVTNAGTGSGIVNGTGISCGADCSETYDTQPSVTLTATPSVGSTFAGWSGGGCAGTGTCRIIMTANNAVTATFNAGPGGGGNVTCAPASQTQTLSGGIAYADVSAAGGNDMYDWNAAGSTTGLILNRASPINLLYRARGTFSVTASSTGDIATCQVIIQ